MQRVFDPTRGLLNYYITDLMHGPRIVWLGNAKIVLPAISLATVWWTFGGPMLVFLAGLQSIPESLYEAAKNSSHLRSPDHDFYAAVKARHDGKIAAISVARKLARRCYHVLCSIEPELVYAIPA